MKQLSLALVLMAVATAPLSAELKYTMHMEMKKSEAAPAQRPNPLLGMMADADS